jgi:hypothetical protein
MVAVITQALNVLTVLTVLTVQTVQTVQTVLTLRQAGGRMIVPPESSGMFA